MAARLAQELEKQLSKIDHNADDPAVLLEAFVTVSECVETYLTLSRQATQSQEVRDSRTKFCWIWAELPQFPLRRFLPSAAKALARFPQHRGLVLVIADLCTDICKQNVLAKMEAMQCGILQGLCVAAGALAVSGLSEKFEEDEFLLMRRIFEALRKTVETPSIQFYSQPREQKDEFYAVERRAWEEVDLAEALKALEEQGALERFSGANHALILTMCFFNKYRDFDNVEHYLQVLKNMGEAFDNTFPATAGNDAFEKFLKNSLQASTAPGAPLGHLMYSHAELIAEALLILKRTMNPAEVPWNHRNPCLLPSLNRLYLTLSDVTLYSMTSEMYCYNERRKEYREMIIKTARKYAMANRGAPANTSSAGTTEPRDGGNAATGADGPGRGEGRRQSRGKKCAHCSKLQKDREPGQPTFKKCGQCRTTFYCGAQCQKLDWRKHKLECMPYLI